MLTASLCLLFAAALQTLAFGRRMVPLAGWLAPVFLLFFAREAGPVAGYFGVAAVLAAGMAAATRGVIPLPGIARFVLIVASAAAGALPFLADLLLAPHLPGFASTLVLPLAWTALEFLASRLNPYGTWGALGYTQHGNLPLMQLVSVTGLWGIGFLITWFAAVANWAWDMRFEWGAVADGVLLYLAVWLTVMLAGGLRLALAPVARTVRVAGIGWPRGIADADDFMRALSPDISAAERETLRAQFDALRTSFFACSLRETRAGARIVVWPEACLMVFREDEAACIEEAKRFARDNAVYLLAAMAAIEPESPRPLENKALLFGPSGEILYSYVKTTAVPGFEARLARRGMAPIPVAVTPFGRIMSPICFDFDFPPLIRQTGKMQADIVLAPASDWKEITLLHQAMAEFRAVENGVALFRITRWGGSGAVDPYGRRLAAMDDFAAEEPVLVAQLPVSAGRRTIYAAVGDLFAWSCVGGFALCAGWALS